MSKDISLTDFENLLLIKNQLLTLSSDRLIDLYQNIDDYVIFIDTIICMLKEESAFLYLDKEIVNKIQKVLQIHRFDIGNTEIIDAINAVTLYLNDVGCASDDYRKMLVISYEEYQKCIRDTSFDEFSDFLYVLSCDAPVFLSLKGVIELPEIDNSILLPSIIYLLERCPGFFENKNVHDRAEKMLNNIYSNSGVFSLETKIVTSRTKKKLKKIELKEE